MKIENISLNTHNGKLPAFSKNSGINQLNSKGLFMSVDEFIKNEINSEIEKERNQVLKNAKTNFFKIGKSFQKII